MGAIRGTHRPIGIMGDHRKGGCYQPPFPHPLQDALCLLGLLSALHSQAGLFAFGFSNRARARDGGQRHLRLTFTL